MRNPSGWIEGASILAAVFLVSSVTAGNDFLKDRQFRALEKEKDNDLVLVLRNGKIVQIQVSKLDLCCCKGALA
jgi:Ca2+ transporting ATPase